jgi:hypothetical protein
MLTKPTDINFIDWPGSPDAADGTITHYPFGSGQMPDAVSALDAANAAITNEPGWLARHQKNFPPTGVKK